MSTGDFASRRRTKRAEQSSRSTRRAARRAPCCRCSIWRRPERNLAAARGDGLCRGASSAWRRSGSTRSRRSIRCSTWSRSASGPAGLRTTPCWLRGADDYQHLRAQARHRHGRDDAGRPVLPEGGRVPGRLRQRAGRPGQRRLLRGPRCRRDGEAHRPARVRQSAAQGLGDRPAELGPGRRSIDAR